MYHNHKLQTNPWHREEMLTPRTKFVKTKNEKVIAENPCEKHKKVELVKHSIVRKYFNTKLFFHFHSYIRLMKTTLSNDVADGSKITPCNKIDKPLVVYRVSGNVVTSIAPLCTY